ncbi:unnamed protein product [Pseudo-nitzschia multistriata]|uniref:Disease resistance R13L4/SHOC-2-like LRR domain-containing protein n=1 Tax=Pseudo-nitzschia multistriata TaxID=183589 RepID=A0A448Z2I1_9STRA|nr:unnamed protein product [Pseudo-nitzschia multistriata]
MAPSVPPKSEATGGKKKKKKSKRNIIDKIPDIPGHDSNDHLVPYAISPLKTNGLGVEPEGTSVCPIYVSDYEDSSEVAIRGDRKINHKLFQTELPSTTKNTNKPTEEKADDNELDHEEAAPQKPASRKKRNLKKSIKKLSDNKKVENTGKLLTEDNLKEIEKEPLCIDVTAYGDDEDDPVLERELEEIALNGRRSGLISGTPDKFAYDTQKGKPKGWRRLTKKTKKKKNKISPDIENNYNEDDERSWHVGTLTKDKDAKKKKMSFEKKIYSVSIIFAVLMAIGCLSYGIIRSNYPKPGDSLTAEQKGIHEVLTRVTGEKTLTDTGTPQHSAWEWLLYTDEEIWNAEGAEGIIQRFALACFYFSTGGNDSKPKKWESNNWMEGPECGDENHEAWIGVNCNSDGEIRALALDAWGLSGTIPPEIGHLSKLENLILKNNPNLTGWIPPSFSHLANLRQLGLYNNHLSGVLPDIFEHTKSLKFINLESNDIYGSIPLEISHLTSLETLVLKGNRFEGIVPFKQLASTSVRYLGLSNNRFAGRIEKAIHDVETLEYLYLDHNALRGTIPPHIGNLKQLKSIDLGHNAFTGALPMSIGNLDRLEYFSLNDNKLAGSLPRRIGSLTRLNTLNMASNTFTGTVPDLSTLTNLKSLQLYSNELQGTLPKSLQHLQSIESIFLSSNRFTGTIPEEISLVSRTLTGFYLSDNLLVGSIPTHLCEFIGLEALFLDTNRFDGTIPSCLGELEDLQQLYLFKNKLTGTVPTTFQNLKHLTGIGLESNQLVGEVSDEVCGLVHHQEVDMWADCGVGETALQCPCCSVCCPGDSCV